MSESVPPLALHEVRKAECSQCGGIRNCDIRGEHLVRYGDEQFSANTHWYILECRGCENVFVQTASINSEDYDDFYEDDGSPGTTYNETMRYWPALSKRRKPEWMSEYGIDAENVGALDAAMIELYGALDNDLRMLSAIGIRTAFDIASELLGIDGQMAFDKKLDALVSSGRIGVVDKDRLEMVVDAGSASAHRGWRPTPNDLGIMMDVLEHFVHQSFVAPARRAKLDAEAAKVKKTVPPRAPRSKKPPSIAREADT
jgi:hypothetical protein